MRIEERIQHLPSAPESTSRQKHGISRSVTGMPGVTNLITFPFDAARNVQTIRHAYTTRDREEMVDASIKTLSIPFMIGNGLGISVDFMVEVHLLNPATFAIVSFFGTIAGLVLCSLELLIEGLSLTQIQWFRGQLNLDLLEACSRAQNEPREKQEAFLTKVGLHLLDNKAAYQEIFGTEVYEEFVHHVKTRLGKIYTHPNLGELIKEVQGIFTLYSVSYLKKRYLTITPEEREAICEEARKQHTDASPLERETYVQQECENRIQGRRAMLKRRVSGWLAEKIETHTLALPDVKGPPKADEALAPHPQSEALLSDIAMQTRKKEIIHAVGIACLITLIAGLAVSFGGGAPLLLLIAVYAVGFALAGARYALYKGLLKSPDWTFHWEKVPPKWAHKVWKTCCSCWHKEHLPAEKITATPKTKLDKQSGYIDSYEQWKALPRSIQVYV